MKASVQILIYSIFLSLLTVAPAAGAMIHLTSNPTTLSSTLSLPIATPTNMYVVADNFSAGQTVGEFAFSLTGFGDPSLLITNWDFGTGAVIEGSPPLDVVVGLPTLTTTSEPVLLATISLFALAGLSDILISIEPPSPSTSTASFSPPAPLWFDRSTYNIYPFTYASDLVINPFSLEAPPLYPSVPPVPEPSTFLLLGGGLAGLVLVVRRRKKE